MNKKQVSSSGQQRIQRESGSVVVIVAVSLTALLGFAGLAIDYGYAFSQKTRL
ncbi:TadE/TadG family type IV pilus assembly protein [Orrella marina]|uniref:Putative Flp pilus-assembly TadG-like N-terminal domain-containing protein n=1 Tax=Orrella marina TaxID=2163011 RepID=A0A2R4XFB5_9BURK|nr:Tad domain-containing protein [Orrella marina]AWB32461.1 hypothetical protein DBV39_00625 [Orrella marina]